MRGGNYVISSVRPREAGHGGFLFPKMQNPGFWLRKLSMFSTIETEDAKQKLTRRDPTLWKIDAPRLPMNSQEIGKVCPFTSAACQQGSFFFWRGCKLIMNNDVRLHHLSTG